MFFFLSDSSLVGIYLEVVCEDCEIDIRCMLLTLSRRLTWWLNTVSLYLILQSDLSEGTWNTFMKKLLRPVYTGNFCRGNSMQFLSRQNCIKFQTCSKPLRYRGDKSQWKSHLVYLCDFEVATLSATKIASSCWDKNRLCKRAFRLVIRQ